ncbi:MAG TPA: phage holin family protein [Pseudonocardiaceae bacterium]
MAVLIQVIITAVAVWVSTALPGIDLGAGSLGSKILTLLGVALIFGLVNAVVKPVVKVLGCMFYVITLGLIGLVVNGLLFWLTGWIAGELDLPFHVAGFWPAFWGAIIVSLVTFILQVGVRAQAEDARRR